MSLYRIRFSYQGGAWRVVSVRRSNEFALLPIQNIERKGPGRAYLPVLSDREPHEFIIGPHPVTPYLCICAYLNSLPRHVKDMRRMEYLQARGVEAPNDLDFAATA